MTRSATRAAANCITAVLTFGLIGCAHSHRDAASDHGQTTQESAGPDFWDAIPASSSTTVPDAIQDDYWHGQFQRVNQEVAKADAPIGAVRRGISSTAWDDRQSSRFQGRCPHTQS
jgi:hypothetical protein